MNLKSSQVSIYPKLWITALFLLFITTTSPLLAVNPWADSLARPDKIVTSLPARLLLDPYGKVGVEVCYLLGQEHGRECPNAQGRHEVTLAEWCQLLDQLPLPAGGHIEDRPACPATWLANTVSPPIPLQYEP